MKALSGRSLKAWCAAGLMALAVSLPAAAQTVHGGKRWEGYEEFRSFYRAPNIAQIPSILAALHRTGGKDWTPHPPIVGFLAGVIVKHGAITLPANAAPALQADLALAYSLAGNWRGAVALAGQFGLPEAHTAVIAGTAPFELQRIHNATVLDYFWGAAFATGDPKYVRPIARRFVEIVRSEQIGDDVLALALRSRSQDARAVRQRYTSDTIYDVTVAMAILKAITMNGIEHDFIRDTAMAEIGRDNPASRTLGTFLSSATPGDLRPDLAPSPRSP